MMFHVLFIGLWFCLVCTACSFAPQASPLRLDFESDADLDQLQWHCKTMYSRSNEHATQGEYSLKVDFYPSDYPRFEPLMHKQDWSRHRALCCDVYNPQDSPVAVTLRIDDDITSPTFYDCYIEHIKLPPGHTTITIAIDDLRGCLTRRPLQTNAIRKFMLFMTRPNRQYTLYIDNLRLVG